MTLYNLEHILNLEQWQKLQDTLANFTKLAIITIDYKGNPVTNHSSCTPFCQEIRRDETLNILCQKCDSRAGLEAVRNKSPYIYLCHCNIIDIAIPITIDDKYIGAVMAGQVKATSSKDIANLEHILHSPTSMNAIKKSKKLKKLHQKIPVLDYSAIVNISDMLFQMCNYMIGEATTKNTVTDMYNSLVTANHPLPLDSHMLSRKQDNPEKNVDIAIPIPKNQKLLPVLEYIYTNTHVILSMEEAAQICHLSGSHFSRSFAKEFGIPYTTYITQLKIKWAKELLDNTDLSITQVSDQLGFNEPGYFIKIFKKHEYLTPALYRKYMQ